MHVRNELGGQKGRPISLISQFTGKAIPTKLKVGDGLVSSRIGETFDAIGTGLTSHGTFVPVLKPAVEGLFGTRTAGADVGGQTAREADQGGCRRTY
jgi:hypothetical protein